MAKCGTCNYTSGHTAWCPVGHPEKKDSGKTPQDNKRNFKKRDDDGRSKKK